MINNAADLIITSASAGATLLVKEWGQSSQRVIPLIDGVDTDIFCPLPQDEARKRFGLPLDIPIVAYLGLMNQYQGTDLLLDCIEILKNKGIKAFFLLMGFPCEKYRATAEKRGLSPFIRFTGKVDYADAPQLLAAADLAVTPKLSLTEANGKIFNYMSCGLAVAAFDTQVNREALGDTGVYAKFGNRNDLAEKIEELINSPQECRKLGRSSREKAVQEHSWLSRGKKLVTIYTGLIQRSDKPQP